MNNSSLDQTKQPNTKADSKQHMKKKAPISLITNTQTIFIKNKLGNIASSYIDGSQKIQKLNKGNTLGMGNCINQPSAPMNSVNNHIKNQNQTNVNISKTVQEPSLGVASSLNNRTNQTLSSHMIINSFTSKLNHIQLKDVGLKGNQVNGNGNCKGNGKKKGNGSDTIASFMNHSKQKVKTNTSNNNTTNTNQNSLMKKMSLKNKKDIADAKKSFVENLDKINSIKSRLNLKENVKFKKVIAKFQTKKMNKKTETVSISLRGGGKIANATFCNHKCLNSLPCEISNVTMPSKIDDNSCNMTQIQTENNNNLYANANTNTDTNGIETTEDLKKATINTTTTETNNAMAKKPKDKARTIMPKVAKASDLTRNSNKTRVSINLGYGHSKQNTSSSLISKTIQNDKEKEKDIENVIVNNKNNPLKPKPFETNPNTNYNNNNNIIKKTIDLGKAPKCPIKLNLLSLIQENKLKFKKEREFNLSHCSHEDIDAILNTDHELLDTQRYKDFDNYDDVNSIVKKIHFEKINKKGITIFSEDNTSYQLFSHKFNDKYNTTILKYKNSEQRTNASGSTCENSSKKQFVQLTKCTLKNNLQIEIP